MYLQVQSLSITAYPYFTAGVLYNFLYKNNVKALCPQLAVQATVNTLTSNHHSSQAGTPGLTSNSRFQGTEDYSKNRSLNPADKLLSSG